jgi:Dyp-type peroxidase family
MSLGPEPALDLDDIQGHILIGFGGGFQELIGVRVRADRLGDVRTALRPWIDRVTTSRVAVRARALRRAARLAGLARAAQPTLTLAISVSSQGLGLLGAGPGPDDPLFREGAARSAGALGDEVDDDGRPHGWRVGDDPSTTPDVFIVLGSQVAEVVRVGAESLLADLADSVDVVYRESGHRLPGDTEHFGFADGISQPGVRGTIDGAAVFTERAYPDDNPLAMTHARPGQPLVWPGQFVFGYPTQRIDDLAPGPAIGEGDALLANGSLLVFRRLRQDVAGFQHGMQALADAFGAQGLAVTAATAAAWCVGRWPDGTPVSLSATGPDPRISGDSIRRNGFDYLRPLPAATLHDRDGVAIGFPGAAADPNGFTCPFFAHVRKVNPRDHPVDQGSTGITLRSQMLRRGVPYGPSWPGAEDGADRGLLFMAYQTSIGNQFHRLMSLWVNNASAPLGDGIDPLLGASPAGGRPLRRRLTPSTSFKVRLPGRWITTTGAGYFFAPGIRTLRRLFGGGEET